MPSVKGRVMRSLNPFQKSLVDCVLTEDYEPYYFLNHEIAFLEMLHMIEFFSPTSSSRLMEVIENKENQRYIVHSPSSDFRLSQSVVRVGFRSPLHPSEILDFESFSATLTGDLPISDTRPEEWDLGLHYQPVVVCKDASLIPKAVINEFPNSQSSDQES